MKVSVAVEVYLCDVVRSSACERGWGEGGNGSDGKEGGGGDYYFMVESLHCSVHAKVFENYANM